MIVVVMGVTGSGKTTVGRALAERLGARFLDADGLHPPANVEKMRRGEPLTDADRAPWLAALRAALAAETARGGDVVLACSALKRAYRAALDPGGARFAYLRVSEALLRDRIAHRAGHFAGAALLPGQFADLEEPGPDEAIVVDVREGESPAALAAGIAGRL